MVAGQVLELRRERGDAPCVEQMRLFIEEADAVVELAFDEAMLNRRRTGAGCAGSIP